MIRWWRILRALWIETDDIQESPSEGQFFGSLKDFYAMAKPESHSKRSCYRVNGTGSHS